MRLIPRFIDQPANVARKESKGAEQGVSRVTGWISPPQGLFPFLKWTFTALPYHLDGGKPRGVIECLFTSSLSTKLAKYSMCKMVVPLTHKGIISVG